MVYPPLKKHASIFNVILLFQAVLKTTAEANALKEKEEKEAMALLEMQLRPRKRKRKLKEVDSAPLSVPLYKSRFFMLSMSCILILLPLFFLLICYMI